MNLYFTSEIRGCLDMFGTPTALKRAQMKYAMTVFNYKLKNEKLAVVVRVPQTTSSELVTLQRSITHVRHSRCRRRRGYRKRAKQKRTC